MKRILLILMMLTQAIWVFGLRAEKSSTELLKNIKTDLIASKGDQQIEPGHNSCEPFCKDIIVELDQNGTATITAADIYNGSTENCEIASIAIDKSSFGCEDIIDGKEPVTHVVISQVYGGGGISGSIFTNDFIELFNSGTTTVDLTGWSVQYASSTGTSWVVTELSGSIQSGHYYLIQQAAGGGGFVNLPSPDAVGTINMAASNGKVLLSNTTTVQSGSCPSGSQIIDLIGYGTANCFETSPTSTLSSTTAAIRKSNGCQDTDNNFEDFNIADPLPRNSATAFAPCILSYTGVPVTLTVIDLEGNESTCVANVNVIDKIAPVITTNGDSEINTDFGVCWANVEIFAASSDNCEVGAPIGIRSDGEPIDAPYPVGVTTITWNVTDINGNEAEEVIQTVTVNDIELPVITAEDQTVSAEAALCTALINLNASASDNCGVDDPIGVRSDGEILGAPFPVGITTIIWNVTDINGNEAETAIQTITVTDDEAPEVFTKNAIIELQPGGSYTLSSGEIDDGSFDNCGIASKTLDKTLFTEDDEGENMVILTVVDLSGNENSAEATVTVIVNREEGCVEAKAKDMILVLDRNGTASLKVNQVDDGSFTNCSNRIVSRELEKSLFTCADLGEQTVSFKAIDSDGNTGETRIKVTVLDETAPIIRNFPRININLGADETYILTDLGEDANISDNCSIESVIQSPEPGTVYDTAGTYSILLKATDTSGNVAERTVTLSIRKNTNNRLADDNEPNGEGNVEHSDLDTMSDQDQVSANSEINLENQLLREIISNGFKIYPNPANHETNILVNLVGESNVEIRIFDAAGRLVFSEESFEEQSFTRSIQLDGLSSGLYNVVVKVNHQFLQGRLIKK
ncbi:lamin tail domain-containing protein [Mongoliibacter ruber]|uniref:Putative secreted protein (Por secretion system target) n=1 Tax=Mongoliibacter ruber TaxID=1750599 RepID=A0A2T0WJQ4_9BACT|nr:lamin tail domain-containing protein [Mongoliibacter ruber]PRY86938.1 putative secreted protein (Por secretion system target) [Mongoliibacter ruber]